MEMLLDYAPLFLALTGAGAIAGVLAGLFGVGGGIVIVPALYAALSTYGYGHDVAMHIATGTSLAIILPTGFSSARAHHHRGAVDGAVVRLLAPSIALGAVAGGVLASMLPGHGLTLFFALFIALVGVAMARGKKGFALVQHMPTGAGRHGLGGIIGLLSAMLGVGGGTLSVPTLAACGYPMTRAAGTGSALGIFIALPGALSFMLMGMEAEGRPPFSLGYVNAPALLLIAPLSALFAPLGAKLAHKLPDLWLRRSFAVMLILIAGKMALKASGH